MKKILLTSTGFDNKNLGRIFVDNIGKPINTVRTLFIPTAANDEESKSVLPFCREDLLNVGVCAENIVDFDLDRQMDIEELMQFDAIYFCGGSETHLMRRVNESGFSSVLLKAIDNGLFYIGVSAGSMIVSSSVENNLGIIKNPLEPHCESNITPCGKIPENGEPLNISDNQGVWITDEVAMVVE